MGMEFQFSVPMCAFLSVPPFLVLFFSSRLPISALPPLASLFLLVFHSPHLWPRISLNRYVTQGNWLLKELKDVLRPSSPTREAAGERNRRQRASTAESPRLPSSNPTPDGGAAAAAAGSGGGDAAGGDGLAGAGAGRASKRFRGGCEFVCRMNKPVRVTFGSFVSSSFGFDLCCSRLAAFGLSEKGQPIFTRLLWVQVSTYVIVCHTLNVKMMCLDCYHSLVPFSNMCERFAMP